MLNFICALQTLAPFIDSFKTKIMCICYVYEVTINFEIPIFE